MSEEDQEEPSEEPPTAAPHCLNCDAELTGQYCGHCGQRAVGRLISVWELVRDAFGDLLDVDSRLWRTLRLMAFRPGRLTAEYLSGRRARYMPPFRTYLVLSLLFFFIVFFDADKFGILFAPSAEESAPAEQKPLLTEEDRRRVEEELAREGIHISPRGEGRNTESGVLSLDFGEGETDCSVEGYDPNDLPGWLGRRLTKERMQQACLNLTANGEEGVRGFFERLIEMIPAALFVLLPVMAMVLKLLYPLSRRFYVEHLLMVVNFHSFVFLALTVQTVLTRTGDWLRLPDPVMMILLTPVVVYLPVYFYKTLRTVYRQGHMLTSLKYLMLIAAYSTGLTFMMLFVGIFAVFQA